MPNPLVFRLSQEDRTALRTFVRTGHTNARTFARAFALLKADQGWSVVRICEAFDVSRNTVLTVRRAYMKRGLKAVMHDKKQKRQRQALTNEQANHLRDIARSPAPAGRKRWTLYMLVNKAIELGYVTSISPETINKILKKTNGNGGGSRDSSGETLS